MPQMSIVLGGITKATLLIALGMGYIVCYLASKAEKNLQKLGYLIGVGIIFLSVSLIIMSLVVSATRVINTGRIMPPMQPMLQQQPMK